MEAMLVLTVRAMVVSPQAAQSVDYAQFFLGVWACFGAGLPL
jgi:hypothetical protein